MYIHIYIYRKDDPKASTGPEDRYAHTYVHVNMHTHICVEIYTHVCEHTYV